MWVGTAFVKFIVPNNCAPRCNKNTSSVSGRHQLWNKRGNNFIFALRAMSVRASRHENKKKHSRKKPGSFKPQKIHIGDHFQMVSFVWHIHRKMLENFPLAIIVKNNNLTFSRRNLPLRADEEKLSLWQCLPLYINIHETCLRST